MRLLKKILSNFHMLCKAPYVVIGNLRNLATSPRVQANHYDVLGITPKATQRDIKSAYYELSKVYHPDKSPDEASAKKFRAITEAYEVLGNVHTKKMYDKGLIVGKENKSRMGWQPEPEPTDPTLRFYKFREHRHVSPHLRSDGRKPMYDFDSWSKNHYGDLFAKSQYNKEFSMKQKIKHEERAIALRQEATVCIVIALAGLFTYFLFNIRDDYDIDHVSGKKPFKDEIKSEVAKPQSVENTTEIVINTPTDSSGNSNNIRTYTNSRQE